MREVWNEILFAARWAPRLYFAPLVGAWRGVQQEIRRVHRCMQIESAQRSRASR
jgi:hypothetical protein